MNQIASIKELVRQIQQKVLDINGITQDEVDGVLTALSEIELQLTNCHE